MMRLLCKIPFYCCPYCYSDYTVIRFNAGKEDDVRWVLRLHHLSNPLCPYDDELLDLPIEKLVVETEVEISGEAIKSV